ncbi:MAG: trigger factor [Clostridia bacterium]|nr:trigger factor [Clostridia bacterium]MBQ4289818.1 trigger factor [Clostridia bacterium]
MALINVTTPDTNVRELEFSLARDVFEKECVKVYKKNVGKYNIPGFRRGKAPKAFIEKMYGKGIFYEDALNNLLPDLYHDVLEESKIDAVSRPEIDVKEMGDEQIILTAKVYVKPEVKLGQYRGIAVTKEVAEVSEESIDNEIQRVRERNSREIDITDRPAQAGDTVVFDFDGKIDGVPFDGGKSEGYRLKLGSGSFIPGFEDQIVGKRIDEPFDVNVTFPDDYAKEDLQGKAAVFSCLIHEIIEIDLPEADDEFAKDVSEFDTIAEYRADIRKKQEKAAEDTAERQMEDQLIDEIVKSMEVDIPQPMIETEIDNQIRNYDLRLRQQGLSLDMYLKYTGLDLTAMRDQYKDQAEKQVKVSLALEEIVKLENIVPTDDQIAEFYTKLSENYGMTADEVRKYVDEEGVRHDAAIEQAVQLIKDSAVVTAPKAETEEQPAEKTEKKKPKRTKKAAPSSEEAAPADAAPEQKE